MTSKPDRLTKAFPVQTDVEHNSGMTLRDYFAAAALTGILAKHGADRGSPSIDARDSYIVADAMMEQRQPNAVSPSRPLKVAL